MRALKAFLLGAVATAIVAYAIAAALAAVAQAGGDPLDLSIGPVVIVSVVVGGKTTVTTFGAGLALIAIAGGLLNVLAARMIVRRSSGGAPMA